MALETIRDLQETVIRNRIFTVYINDERRLMEAASNFFGGQMTEEDFEGIRTGVDNERQSAFGEFSRFLDGRPGLRKSIEIEALGKLCGMYVERLHDEPSSSEFEMFAKDRMAYFLERVQALCGLDEPII